MKAGDRVKIKHGHILATSKLSGATKPDYVVRETQHLWYYDAMPGLIGKIGVIKNISTDKKSVFVILDIEGVEGAWFKKNEVEKL